MVTIICKVCEQPFECMPHDAKLNRTCSNACRVKLRSLHWEEKMFQRFGEQISDLIRRLYCDEGQNTTQIAEVLLLKNGSGRISRLMQRYNIPTRTGGECIAMSWIGQDERKRKAGEGMRSRMTPETYLKGVATRTKLYKSRPGKFERLALDYLTSINEPFEFQVQFGVYIADFVLPSRNLVLEVDSFHHKIAKIAERDKARDEFLKSRGFTTIRIAAHVSVKPGSFLGKLQQILDAQSTVSGSTPTIEQPHIG